MKISKKFTDLPLKSTISSTDIIPITDMDNVPIDRRVTVSTLLSGVSAFLITSSVTSETITNLGNANIQAAVAIPAMDINWLLSGVHTKTLVAGVNTFTFSSKVSGGVIRVRVIGAASTLVWPTVKWPGGVIPTQTASGTDIYTFMYDSIDVYGSVIQNMS